MVQRSDQRPMSLSEWAYKHIKEQVFDNELKPGSQLNIEELSKEMNISRTPIREALLRLKQNGFVVSFSNVGFFVRAITRDDFEDIFELRQLIESYATVKFVEQCTEDKLQGLLDVHKQCVKEAEAGNVKAFNEYDIRLHDMLIRCLGNKKICDVYDNVADLLYRLRVYALNSSENITHSLKEHENLIRAIERKDIAGSKLAMEEHICNIRTRLKKIVDFED